MSEHNNFEATMSEFTTIFEAEFGDFITLYRGVVRVWIGNGENGSDGVLYAEMVDGVIQNLGPVTGYYYARQAGFQGTFLEWVQLLLDATVNASNAAQSASEALASERAAASSEAAAALSETNAATSANQAEGYKTTAVNAKDDAIAAKNTAVDAKNSAQTSESNSEAWAVGQRAGVDVPSTDPTYDNNAKFYAEVAVAGRRFIAPDWYENLTSAFEVGEFVQKDTKIYMFTSPHEANTPWSSSEVEETNLGALLKDLQDNVVRVQQEQPLSENNKIWLRPSEDDIQVPTYEEFNLLVNLTRSKLVKPEQEGTAGQILQSNGDGTTQWIDRAIPTDEQTAAAVTNWLTVHPEATSTVQDGSITLAKLNSSVAQKVNDVDNKAPAIIATSAQKNAFTSAELSEYDNFNIVSDATNYATVYKANAFDIYPSTDATSDQSGRFTKTKGRTVIWNTTISGETVYYFSSVSNSAKYTSVEPIRTGNTVNLFAYVEGAATGSVSASNRVEFYFLRADSTQINKTNVFIPSSTGSATATYTATEDVAYIRVYVVMAGGTFDNFKVTWGGTIGNAYTSVTGGSELRFSKNDIGNNGFSILPVTACAEYIADTKTYIDNNIPDDVVTEDKLVYLSPEMYGAVGNGVEDDTIAIQNCITAAIAAKKPVKGYGVYKITSTITIDCDEMEFYFFRLNYSGSGYAVQLAGRWNTFRFHYIYAMSTDGKGINIVSSVRNGNTERCKVEGNSIYANKECIHITPNTGRYILYYVFDIKVLYTTTGDCVIEDTDRVSEIAIYNAYFSCPTGWCVNGNYIKLYNCTMESNCYGGVYAWMVTIHNCRAREMMDCLMYNNEHHSDRSGILFKAKPYKGSAKVIINIDDVVYYDAIDLSEVLVDSTGTATASVNNAFSGRVNSDICFGDLNYENGHFMIGKGMVLHGKDRVCIPKYRSAYTVDSSTLDLRDIPRNEWNNSRMYYPTDFTIGIDNSTIFLSPSYCAEGYNEFIVDMRLYLTTIYDRRATDNNNLPTPLFSPVGHTEGIYKFTAVSDPTIDTDHQLSPFTINSGYSDRWIIEKIDSSTRITT